MDVSIELDAIKARLNALDLSDGWISRSYSDAPVKFYESDWPFVFHAPSDIAALIEEVGRLRVEFSILRSHVNRWAANGRQLSPLGTFEIIDQARPFPDEIARGF